MTQDDTSSVTHDIEPATVDVRAQRLRPVTIAASALALGALMLPEPARLSPGRRHLLRLGRAAYAGWSMWEYTRRTPLPVVPTEVGGALGGAALTLAVAPVDEAADAWVTDRLRRAGVRRPRVGLALAGATIGALMAVDSQLRPDKTGSWLEADELFEEAPLPDDAGDLVRAMLQAAPSSAAATLSAQLDVATACVLKDDPQFGDVSFIVPDDGQRVVPHTQTWPVRAHLEAQGVPLEIELSVADGRLVSLTVAHRIEDMADDDDRWEREIADLLDSWPRPEDVRLVVETADGLRPLV